jgi:hypothetical protein
MRGRAIAGLIVCITLAAPRGAGAQAAAGGPEPSADRIAPPAGPGAAPLLQPPGGSGVQPSSSGYWLTGGVGFGSRGGAAAVGGSYRFGQNLLSARAAGTIAFFGDELWDIGVLYGRANQPSFIHFSLAAGIGAVGGSGRETLFDPGERLPTTIGVPVEAQLFFRPVPLLGVGLYGFGNVNREESFVGLAAAVQLGRFR